jgi:VanZ family protein
MQKVSFKKFIPGIAWFFIVLVLMVLPGNELPNTDWLHIDFFDKIMHAGVFAFLVFLFCWPFYKSDFSKAERKNYFIKIALSVSIWGLTTEFIQGYIAIGRNFELLDWAADTIGALIAFLIIKKLMA